MKKFLLSVTAIVISSSLYAMDMSQDSGQDTSIKKDKSISAKSSIDQKQSDRNSKNRSNSSQHTVDITFDTFPVYQLVADSCVAKQMSPADFGLSGAIKQDGHVVYDLIQQQLIDAAAKSSEPIEEAGGDSVLLRKYLTCAVQNYSQMAQANLILSKKLGKHSFGSKELMVLALRSFQSAKKKDLFISKNESTALKNISSFTCRFLGVANVVQCGSVSMDFNLNVLKLGNVVLSPGADKYFGVTSSFRVSLSDSLTRANEVADEFAKGHNQDAGMSESKSTSDSESSKQQLNIAPFISKFF